MRILTAIPVYNEARHITPVLEAVRAHAADILVVDDGSRDETPQILATIPGIRVIRHEQNLGYGAALRTAFAAALDGPFDGLVTLDCDGQHEPSLIPAIAAPLTDFDIVSGSRYLKIFDPAQSPPEDRRRINLEVTRWISECLNFHITDAFCGFKAYRASALRLLDTRDPGYAMPLEVWVQAAAHHLSVHEIPVPLIYLDEKRAFGGALDDPIARLKHYRHVFRAALDRAGLRPVGSGCA